MYTFLWTITKKLSIQTRSDYDVTNLMVPCARTTTNTTTTTEITTTTLRNRRVGWVVLLV